MGNPVKFFSNKPSKGLLKNLNINNVNSEMKASKSSEKFNLSSKYRNSVSKIDTGLSNLKRLNSEKDINLKENNSKKKLNEFNINSEPSVKGEKEKALKNIISNINLEESINAIEKPSNFSGEEDLNSS